MDGEAMLNARALLRTIEGELIEGGVELVDRWQEMPDAMLWLDVTSGAHDEERALLTRAFAATPSDLARLQDRRHPPVLEVFDDHLLLVLRGLDAGSDSIDFDTIQIGVLLGSRFLVTRHFDPSPSVDATWAEVQRQPRLLEGGPAALLMRLSRRVADRYLPIVQKLESRLEAIEDEMFERPGDALLGELLVYKRQLKRLRRIASYHVTAFAQLRDGQVDLVPEALAHRVNEVWVQMERIASLSSLYNELANDLMNGYLSLSSHRLNNIMKVLTVVTVIFVPLTFIAGIYGMNFDYMPELRVRGAYFLVLGAMAVLAVALLWIFRRQRWL